MPESNPKSPMSTSTRHRSSLSVASVGGKLAGATIALMLVVTIGIYVGLSRYQRENLMQAKELAVVALARLFTDSCVAGVVFEDDAAVKDTLVTLGRNEEVEYAAVWSVASNGKVERRIGELARGPSETVSSVPSAVELQRKPDRLVLVSPVREQSGAVVAVALLTLSLRSENRAIAEVERRTLLVFSATALGLTLLLMGMARLLIVRPLGKLVVAANRLEAGGSVELDVSSNDEVGQLASAFRSMANAIGVREERISARNRDMRLVLDNVGQGFITLDIDGAVSEERSRIVDEWFGPAGDSPKFWEYLGRVDAPVAAWFHVGWDAIRDDFLPLALGLDQLPATVRTGGRTFELAYRPILKGELLDKVIIVITDVTARIQSEHAEQAQREMMSIFRRILADRHAFEEFFAEASQLVDSLTSWEGTDLSLLKRHVHTLKGNCAFFDLESIVGFCHELEDSMNQSEPGIDVEAKQNLRALWTAVGAMRSQLSQSGTEERIELANNEYEAFLQDLCNQKDHALLVTSALSWRFEPASKRLALLAEQTQRAARRLGKASVEVVCRPTNVRLPSQKWSAFWSVFAHVIRNTVDHGVESAEERRLAGKTEHATVTLDIAYEGDHLVVTIEDDGRGIDWAKLAESARQHRLAYATRADLEKALFTEGISSRSQITTMSGRGIGLAAVRDVVVRLGGTVELRSEPGSGTQFRFLLPLSMLDGTPASATGTAAAAE